MEAFGIRRSCHKENQRANFSHTLNIVFCNQISRLLHDTGHVGASGCLLLTPNHITAPSVPPSTPYPHPSSTPPKQLFSIPRRQDFFPNHIFSPASHKAVSTASQVTVSFSSSKPHFPPQASSPQPLPVAPQVSFPKILFSGGDLRKHVVVEQRFPFTYPR